MINLLLSVLATIGVATVVFCGLVATLILYRGENGDDE